MGADDMPPAIPTAVAPRPLGVHLFNHDQLFGVHQSSTTALFEADGAQTAEKQAVHTRDTALTLQLGLKDALESLFRALFGNDVPMRWVDVSAARARAKNCAKAKMSRRFRRVAHARA